MKQNETRKATDMKKTDEDLSRHLTRVADCGNSFITIRQLVNSQWYIIPTRTKCQSRFCESCSKARRAMLLEKMQYFRDLPHCTKFEITFTADSPDPNIEPEYYSKTWDKLLKRLHRYNKKIKFFRFVELTKNGIPHFHVLCNCYIPQSLLSLHAKESGAGNYVWIKNVDAQHAFKYVTKYISKATGLDLRHAKFFFKSGMRQLSYSRGLFVFCPRNKTYYVSSFDKLNSKTSLREFCEMKYFGFIDEIVSADPNAPPVYECRTTNNFNEDCERLIAIGLTRANLFKLRFDLSAHETQHSNCIYA